MVANVPSTGSDHVPLVASKTLAVFGVTTQYIPVWWGGGGGRVAIASGCRGKGDEGSRMVGTWNQLYRSVCYGDRCFSRRDELGYAWR